MSRRKKADLVRIKNLEKARKARRYGPREVAVAECLERAQDISTAPEPEYLADIITPLCTEESAQPNPITADAPIEIPVFDQAPNKTGRLLPPSAYLDLGGYDPTKPFPNALIPVEIARGALVKLDAMFDIVVVDKANSEIANLNPSSRRNTEAMRLCLGIYCEPNRKRTFTEASIAAASELNRTAWYAQTVRRFVRAFIETGVLPKTRYRVRGSTSTLEDADQESHA